MYAPPHTIIGWLKLYTTAIFRHSSDTSHIAQLHQENIRLRTQVASLEANVATAKDTIEVLLNQFGEADDAIKTLRIILPSLPTSAEADFGEFIDAISVEVRQLQQVGNKP
jgi:hypothetical protein